MGKRKNYFVTFIFEPRYLAIWYKHLKFGMLLEHIHMEGTVSQIFYLGLGSHYFYEI